MIDLEILPPLFDLNAGEDVIMRMLRKGQFYSHTGIYDVFDYPDKPRDPTTYKLRTVPVKVSGQKDPTKMWYNDKDKPEKFELIFRFPPEKTKSVYISEKKSVPPWQGKLVWRYTIEYTDKEKQERVLSTGYFKLSDDKATELNLQYYEKFEVKWIRFTIFYADNPMQRAWFSPIKGEHFNDPDHFPNLRNRIAKTTKDTTKKLMKIKDTGEDYIECNELKPVAWSPELEYILDGTHEHNLHCYFLQANSVLPSPDKRPVWKAPRYLQNVHGYFPISEFQFSKLSSKLILSNSWDKCTVKDKQVFFYEVDGETCGVEQLNPVAPK